MTCLALLSLFSLNAEPQGPSFHAASTPSTLAFPVHPETLGHVPFRDIGDTPLTANVRRFGTLDLDGNQISDAFWLGDAAGAHELQIAMGREQTAGRFRAPMGVLVPTVTKYCCRSHERNRTSVPPPNGPRVAAVRRTRCPPGPP